jgi:hypothetical protein
MAKPPPLPPARPAAAPPMGRPVIVAAPELPTITYVQAKYYRRVRRQLPIWIVIHCTHGAEGAGKALACAQMFHDAPPEHAVSAHYIVDSSAVVQAVSNGAESWHAGARGNLHGESIELCGSADQTREQWLDEKSLPMLGLAARLIRVRCDALGIPVRLLKPTEIRALEPGIVTHAMLAKTYPQDTSHYDPGPHFPLDDLVSAVANAHLGIA